jgi:hypothetical protein
MALTDLRAEKNYTIRQSGYEYTSIIEAEKYVLVGNQLESSLSLFCLLFCATFLAGQGHGALPSLGSQLLP